MIGHVFGIMALAGLAQCRTRLMQEGDIISDGSYSPNVIGGNEVKPAFKYPWVVSLQWKGNHVCGGTLIKADMVLTAAHCSTGSQGEFMVAVHRHNLAKSLTDEGAEIFKVLNRYVHESYNAMSNFNDVALWKLSGSYSGKFQPVVMDDGKASVAGTSVFGIGWGRVRVDGPLSPVLMQVEVPITNPDICINAMKEQGYTISTELQVCAGAPEGGKDTCQGDSGGPLVAIKENGPVLVGITSFGISCALPNLPGVS
ncbi:Enteropeptidase, variant 2 [Entomophthora muscae]|uniref:Enteropeptidase, variant 2 n=1 Tax=Entomophthora muscae TaxID=34485 RepID=A0ACC2UNU2_9FUNG|nr:Enteropeptidase, variant 2 [Entomophthora muscae]